MLVCVCASLCDYMCMFMCMRMYMCMCAWAAEVMAECAPQSSVSVRPLEKKPLTEPRACRQPSLPELRDLLSAAPGLEFDTCCRRA